MQNYKKIFISSNTLLGTMGWVLNALDFDKLDHILINCELGHKKNVLQGNIISNIRKLFSIVFTSKEKIILYVLGDKLYLPCYILKKIYTNKIRIYLLSDEIRMPNDRKILLFGYILFFTEQLLTRVADKIFIQDKLRKKIYLNIFRTKSDKVYYYPNSSKSNKIKYNDFINKNKTLLWIGRMEPKDFILNIIKKIKKSDCKLIIQNRDISKNKFKNYIYEKSLEQNNIKYYSKPLPFSEVNNLVKMCNIGLVAFEIDNVNSRCIGHSSGKINSYLKYGKPIIFQGGYGLKWIKKNKLGIEISDYSNFNDAIIEITANYDYYSENCKAYFSKYLCLNNYTKEINILNDNN